MYIFPLMSLKIHNGILHTFSAFNLISKSPLTFIQQFDFSLQKCFNKKEVGAATLKIDNLNMTVREGKHYVLFNWNGGGV